MLKWIRGWLSYLFEGPVDWTKFWCRLKGHEEQIYYTMTGSEPDDRCKNCLDHI